MVWSGSPPGSLDRDARIAYLGAPYGSPFMQLERLTMKGCFSAVAVRRGGLLLGRGRFGGRPLFYARGPHGSLVVCSRLAPLAATSPDACDLDLEKLAAMLTGSTPSERDRTVFRGVHRLASGEWIQFFPDGSNSRSTSRLRPSHIPLSSARELVRELRRRLMVSVARALEGSKRVAVMVSGGVDSSALLAMVLAHSRGAGAREVDALNLVFGGAGDDRPYMQILESSLGIVPVRLRPADGAPHIIPSFVADAAPFPWPTCGWDVAMGLAARARGADLILSGHGGDDMFQGDPEFFVEHAEAGHLMDALWRAIRLEVHWSASSFEKVQWLVLRPLLRRLAPPRLRRVVRGLRKRQASAFAWAGPRLRHYLNGLEARASRAERHEGEAYFDRLAMGDMSLEIRDSRAQFEELTGCTTVDPFLDDDIAEFCAAVPAEAFFRGGRSRGLYRDALDGLVPDTIRMRPDKARFEVALTEMLRALGVGPLEPFLRMETLGDLGLVEPHKYRLRFSEFLHDPSVGSAWPEVWPALGIEAFARRFVAGAGVPRRDTP
jgi:asparagine synthase (glutamine-hydrolysing)